MSAMSAMTPPSRFPPRRRAALGVGLALAGLGAFGLARLDPDAVEAVYSQGIFPGLATALAGVARRLPFSLAEASIAVALLAAATLAVRGIRRARRGGWRGVAAAGGANLLLAGGVGLFAFELAWGLHHARRPLAAHLGVDAGPPTVEALHAAARTLAERAARTRAALGEEGLASCELRPLRNGTNEALDEAWTRAGRRLPPLAGPAPLVRFPRASRVLTLAGLTGIYSPFTGEAHVNGELPVVLLPFVACHEIAHQRGFAREDEANFLGWFVTSLSTDASFRYSGELVALDHLRLALLRADVAAGAALTASLDPRVREDLAEVHAFWRREQRSSVARGMTRVVMRTNDLYLKGQGQAHGVASYGRMVDLLVAHLPGDVGVAAPSVGAPADER